MSKRISVSFTWRVLIIGLSVIGILLLGIMYAGFHLYTKIVANENAQKLILANQDNARIAEEQKSAELIKAQQEALTQAQDELSKTKTDTAKTDAQVKTLTQALNTQQKSPKDIIISSADLSPYVTSVVQVICASPTTVSSGSGTLWTFKEAPYAVVTNYHVVKGADTCVLVIADTTNTVIGMFNLSGAIQTFNPSVDEAILTIGSSTGNQNIPIANYNYSLSTMRQCPNQTPVGTPVVIIGFPAYAKRDSTVSIGGIGTVNVIYRTVTNGIISGYDTSGGGNANYFVSAKIDNGNSGGMALAKDTNGLCLLGLPTWLTVGNYETQGLVQNIINVLPKK